MGNVMATVVLVDEPQVSVPRMDAEDVKVVLPSRTYSALFNAVQDNMPVEAAGALVGRTLRQAGRDWLTISDMVPVELVPVEGGVTLDWRAWQKLKARLTQEGATDSVVGWFYVEPSGSMAARRLDLDLVQAALAGEVDLFLSIDPAAGALAAIVRRGERFAPIGGFYEAVGDQTRARPVLPGSKQRAGSSKSKRSRSPEWVAGAAYRAADDELDALFDEGAAAFGRGEWGEARALLTRVLRRDPNFTRGGRSAARLLEEAYGGGVAITHQRPARLSTFPKVAAAGVLGVALVGALLVQNRPDDKAQKAAAASMQPTPTVAIEENATSASVRVSVQTPTPESAPPLAEGLPAAETAKPQVTVVAGGNRLLLQDGDFEGGYSLEDGRYRDRTARLLYGQGTEYSTMTVRFNLNLTAVAPDSTSAITLVGLDSQGPGTVFIRVTLNDEPVYEGANPLPDDTPLEQGGPANWGSYTWQVPSIKLRQGVNALTISVLDPGNVTAEMLFALDYVSVTLK